MKSMKHAWLVLPSILATLACSGPSSSRAAVPAKAPWSYEGRTGPAHWGELDAGYVLAKTGRRQSPVDIVTAKIVRQQAAALEASYGDTSLEVLNNGHTIEDDYHGGGTLTIDGRVFRLAQFHFHSPSEHTLDGEHAPMEVHLVHEDAGGKLAVIGVLIREGREHPELAKLWQHLPRSAGRTEAVEGVTVNAERLLPASLASYRYSGSLTTPPCTEDVSWFVLEQSIEASAEQIAAFRAVIHGNNRPTQPLNGRTIALVR
jgi:carbonic anhydrase